MIKLLYNLIFSSDSTLLEQTIKEDKEIQENIQRYL